MLFSVQKSPVMCYCKEFEQRYTQFLNLSLIYETVNSFSEFAYDFKVPLNLGTRNLQLNLKYTY